ncbi:nitroreductase family protein [Nocardia sp. NPDC023988]|uniref:nitroreductase family protein n=1 Tax=unclassified Nocardia TaxID=2637762 RepID=UPI0033F99441
MVAFRVTVHATALHPFVLERYSPTGFRRDHTLSSAEVHSLFEAARRAPSAGNSQPWRFIAGVRGDAVHRRLTGFLARSSAAWAPDASLLVANLVQRRVEDTDFEYSEFADYDLGQAVAHLTFQANALGLQVHQFRAFDRDGLHQEFELPDHWEIATMAAVGRPGADATGTDRRRKPLDDVMWTVANIGSQHARSGAAEE